MAKRTSESSNDIARLKGKRLVVLPETDENERLNTALLKQMAAGDMVTARYLFQEFFDFEFTAKLWIATNHKPKIYDSSPGLWDRLKLIPFNTRISNEREVKRDALLSELRDEWPAILAWAVKGCLDYFELKGFCVPEAIQRAIDEYRFEQDSIAQFLEYSCHTYEKALENAALHDRVEVDERDYRASNSGLFDAYKSYCKANNEYQYSQRVFTQKLTERGFKQKNSAGRYWEGVRLLES